MYIHITVRNTIYIYIYVCECAVSGFLYNVISCRSGLRAPSNTLVCILGARDQLQSRWIVESKFAGQIQYFGKL